MRTIIYDKNALYWNKDNNYNLSFLQLWGDHLRKMFKYRGYLYLNQIYEKFGVGWNPEDVNDLYLLDDGEITFVFESTDESSILIRIKQ